LAHGLHRTAGLFAAGVAALRRMAWVDVAEPCELLMGESPSRVLMREMASGDVREADPSSPTRTPEAIPKLCVEGLAKRYGSVDALLPTDLTVATGEFLTVLGPSGSGKTTLLHLICGLAEPTAGRLLIDGVDHTATPVHRRQIGVVFQNYALFPHLTVEENVAFPLQMRKLCRADLNAKVARALEMVSLDGLGDRFPRELSGGQQQRVALARCFVFEPALILMDEPLGALDRKLREAMQIEVKRLHRESGATIIFVTHDQEEALALSDRICLMNQARVEQIGTPREIYEAPSSIFVAEFIGISNVLRGRVERAGVLTTADGAFEIPSGASSLAQRGHEAALIVRPEHLEIVPGSGLVTGRIVESVFGGAETRFLITLPSGAMITARRSGGEAELHVGETVGLRWRADRARLIRC
jgi:putative spermidine/putrescine transport system ATP-binding protein